MEPAVKPAVENTRTGHIGVLATPTTFQGFLYQELVHRFGREVTIHTQTCPGLVEFIEAGQMDEETTTILLKKCLQPLSKNNIDQLVLGCTHYPFIMGVAQSILGDRVTLINPAPAVARQTGRLIKQDSMINRGTQVPKHVLFTSGSVNHLNTIAKALVGYKGQVLRSTWQNGILAASKRSI